MIRLFNEPRPIKELIAEVLASLQPDEPKQSHKEFSEKYAVLKSIYYLKNNSQKVCKMQLLAHTTPSIGKKKKTLRQKKKLNVKI